MKATDHANIKVKAFIPPQHPRIAITKSPESQTVTTKFKTTKGAGGANKTTVTYGTAHFTIKVTNTGDVTLHDVTVNDPLSTNCNKIARVARSRQVEDVQLHQARRDRELHERRDRDRHLAQGRQGACVRHGERQGHDEDVEHERRQVHGLGPGYTSRTDATRPPAGLRP